MKLLRKPRSWIALVAGIAGGLLVLLLPPRPSGTLPVPMPPVDGKIAYVQMRAMSSDGRFLATGQGYWEEPIGLSFDGESTAVWDRQRHSLTPLISLRGRNSYCLLSPDASICCIGNAGYDVQVETPTGATTMVRKPESITLFELPSGQKLKEIQTTAENVWFAPDGTLLAVEKLRVYELDNDREVKQLPAKIDGFEYKKILGEYAVYTKGFQPAEVRVIAWRSGDVCASATFPQADWVMQVSSDGQVLCWIERNWSTLFMRDVNSSRILDAATGFHRDFDQPAFAARFTRPSPDGEVFASIEKQRPLPKWLAWLPIRRDGSAMRIERWRTQDTLALMPHVNEVCFSADGTQLAAARDDCVIEIYDFPFRTPWGLISAAALLSAACSWCVGWLWSRWRKTRACIPRNVG